jgi:hypothetical protein
MMSSRLQLPSSCDVWLQLRGICLEVINRLVDADFIRMVNEDGEHLGLTASWLLEICMAVVLSSACPYLQP